MTAAPLDYTALTPEQLQDVIAEAREQLRRERLGSKVDRPCRSGRHTIPAGQEQCTPCCQERERRRYAAKRRKVA